MFTWRNPRAFPEEWAADYDKTASMNRFELIDGKAVIPGGVRFNSTASTRDIAHYPCIGNSTGIPLVDSRVISVLAQHAGDQVQILRATIVCADAVLDSFSLVVATKAITGVDQSLSKYRLIPGTKAIMRFDRLVLLPKCMSGLVIARLAEFLPLLLVAESLAKKLNEVEGDLGVYPLKDVIPGL